MTASFLATIERVKRDLPGSFAVCAARLEGHGRDDAPLAWNEHTVFPAASVIKIALALEVLCAIDEGVLAASEQLELREHDKVVGSGVLAALEPGLRLPVGDLLTLAMVISDNTATNLLVDRVGVAAINTRLAGLGLATTRLTGRLMVDETRGAPSEGGSGERSPTTAAELVSLLRCVHARDGLPPGACERLLALLARTQTASTVGRGLPDERFPGIGSSPPAIALAYKTGSIRGVIAEAAIVRTPRAHYAVALLSEGSGDLRPNHDNIGRVLLGELSRAVYATFDA